MKSMNRALNEPVLKRDKWKFVESSLFEIDMDGFDEYDKGFPAKERGGAPARKSSGFCLTP